MIYTKLIYQNYNKKYHFILVKDFQITLPKDVGQFETDFFKVHNFELTLKAGYSWNIEGLALFEAENLVLSSLVHNALYQLLKSRSIGMRFRKMSDKIFLKLAKESRVNFFRRRFIYRFYRIFGKFKLKFTKNPCPLKLEADKIIETLS